MLYTLKAVFEAKLTEKSETVIVDTTTTLTHSPYGSQINPVGEYRRDQIEIFSIGQKTQTEYFPMNLLKLYAYDILKEPTARAATDVTFVASLCRYSGLS